MKIGFDAKRLFLNRSGLGNYSRSTVNALYRFHPENRYTLFSPKKGNPLGVEIPEDIETFYPRGLASLTPSLWRNYGMSGAINRSGIEIYHGLSNEIPADIKRAKSVKSVVTMHDLIFVRYPELFTPFDKNMYVAKYRRSCRDADRIIAISNQTRQDLMDFWKIPEEKISVVHQGCNPVFAKKVAEKKKEEVRSKYALPKSYIVSVGTIEQRKNLMLTLEAMSQGFVDTELVAVGKYTPYVETLREYALRQGIAHRLHIHHNVPLEDLPAIYQMSGAVVYTSIFEGFGIPILEGLNSGVPVITTRGGVFPEAGGNACLYVDPGNVDEMIAALNSALYDRETREMAIIRGHIHAAKFKEERIAENLMAVYKSML